MFCDNCGNKLRDGAKFCPKCGSKAISSIEEIRERQRLTPDFSGIDDSKPIHERIKDIDKPVFKNDDDTKIEKTKKTKKKPIIIISVVLVLAVVIGVMLFMNLNRSDFTLDSACDEYITFLKNSRGQIEECSKTNNINNVAICSDSKLKLPFLLYLTNKDNHKVSLRNLYAKGKNIENNDSLTIGQSKKMVFFKIVSDDSLYFWYDYGLWKLDSIDGNIKHLAQIWRYIGSDHKVEKIERVIFSEKGDEKIVSKSKYNSLISGYLSKDVVIILSSMSDDQLSKYFPNIKGNTSLNYDQAIKALEKRQIPK